MIENILLRDNFINNMDKIVFYVFLKKYNKLPLDERVRKLNSIINNLYNSIIKDDNALDKYFINGIKDTIYFDVNSIIGIKESNYFNAIDKEVLIKILLLENICRIRLVINNSSYEEEEFSNIFDDILSKSTNKLRIMSYLYSDFYYVSSNIEYQFRSGITDYFSMMYILKYPDNIKDELFGNNKYKLMISNLISKYYGYGNYNNASIHAKETYYRNIVNFCSVINDYQITSLFGDEKYLIRGFYKNKGSNTNYRRFQPDDSMLGFNFGGYKSLISIDSLGNVYSYYNSDHYQLVENAYHLYSRTDSFTYFDTLLFQASIGNITIITEGSSAYVYLPQYINEEQFNKMKEVLDGYGTTDRNAIFRMCRVLTTNNMKDVYEYNGEKIDFESCEVAGSDCFSYNDFLDTARDLIDKSREVSNTHKSKPRYSRRIRNYLGSNFGK